MVCSRGVGLEMSVFGGERGELGLGRRGLRTAAVVLRVVRERMKVRMERVAVVLRRGWLLGLEGDIVWMVG